MKFDGLSCTIAAGLEQAEEELNELVDVFALNNDMEVTGLIMTMTTVL